MPSLHFRSAGTVVYVHKGLSDKQRALVDAYFTNGFNKTEAAKTAGYSPDAPDRVNCNIWNIFGNRHVAEEIKLRQEAIRERYELTEDWVVQRFMRLADANLGEIMIKLQDSDYDLSVLTMDERYALTEVAEEVYTEGRGGEAVEVKKFRVKTNDPVKSLVNLGKKLGIFTENVNVSGEVSLVDRLQAGRKRVNAENAAQRAIEEEQVESD